MDQASVPLHPVRPGLPELVLTVFGVTPRELRAIPTGGQLARQACRVCRIDPNDYQASFWEVM